MRSVLFAAAFSALTALAVTGVSGAAPGSTITIHTIQIGTGSTVVDADHNGKASVGDYFVVTAKHLDPATHKPTGGGTAICTEIDTTGTVYDCQGEDHFAGGDLRESGRLLLTTKGLRFAVLGGTGSYAGVTGEVRGTWLDTKFMKARDTFTFSKR